MPPPTSVRLCGPPLGDAALLRRDQAQQRDNPTRISTMLQTSPWRTLKSILLPLLLIGGTSLAMIG